MNSLILVILAGFLLGGMYLSAKQFASEKFHALTYTVTYSLFCMIISFPFAWIDFSLPYDFWHWTLALLSPISFALGNMFAYKAYTTTDASKVGLLGRFGLVVTFILSILFLGEQVSFNGYIGLVLVTIGGMSMLFKGQKLDFSKGTYFSLLMAFFYGLTGVVDKVVVEQFSPFTYVFFNNLVIFVLFIIFFPWVRKEMIALSKWNLRLAFQTSALGSLGWLFFLISIRTSYVATYFSISETLSLVTTVILGVIFFKESEQLWQKIFGLIASIVGIVLLAL